MTAVLPPPTPARPLPIVTADRPPSAHGQTFAVFNFGCKANAWDGQALREQLLMAGAREIDPDHVAPDLVVVNSCTVTDTADREALATLNRIRAAYPQARLIATGCMADIRPDTMLAAAGGADRAILLPTQAKPAILEHLGLRPLPAGPLATTSPTTTTIHHFAHHSRAFVKIEDGCDLCCSFCIIPQARGMPRSRPPAEILREIQHLAVAGYREVVLTGIHLGAYGKDFAPDAHFAGANSAKRGPNRIAELLEQLLALPISVRFRLSSLEVTELDNRLLDLFARHPDRLCPHLHLPLQAGEDGILKAMRRWYTTADFSAAVDRLRRRLPDVAISTDVIVGFPGETRAAFDQTLRYCHDLQFSRLHVFPYSPRQKTIASRLPGHLPWRERRARAAELRQVGIELSTAYHRRFIGREAVAVLERNPRRGDHFDFAGYTEHYVPIRAAAPAALTVPGIALGRQARVRLNAPLPETLADHLGPALAAEIIELRD